MSFRTSILYKVFPYLKLRDRLYKELSNLRSNDEIILPLMSGFATTGSDGIKRTRLPTYHKVMNNDPIAKKIWLTFELTSGDDVHRVLEYKSHGLEDYILLNITVENQEPSIELNHSTLNKQLEEAVNKQNFELAKIINEKIKAVNNQIKKL